MKREKESVRRGTRRGGGVARGTTRNQTERKNIRRSSEKMSRGNSIISNILDDDVISDTSCEGNKEECDNGPAISEKKGFEEEDFKITEEIDFENSSSTSTSNDTNVYKVPDEKSDNVKEGGNDSKSKKRGMNASEVISDILSKIDESEEMQKPESP